jgi:serine/threonine protein kinase
MALYEGGRVPVELARWIVWHLLLALMRLEDDADIVHRDIKASNIYI